MYRVIHYGIGALGAQVVQAAMRRPGVAIVGAIDNDSEKAGRDLGEVVGEARLGLPISADSDGTLRSLPADIVLHTTGSFLRETREQLLGIIAAGKNVVSTCEELAYALAQQPDIAAELDRAARQAGVTVLGTGINPGFLMDFLPVTLSAMCQEVRSIRVERVADASQRRLPLQKKIGAGMTVLEFRAKAADGAMGHIGLVESVALIAAALNWTLDAVETTLEPEIATEDVRTRYLDVKAGQVTGIHQIARGMAGGQAKITLDLSMHVAVKQAVDTVIIDGVPPIRSTIPGGVNGDIATIGILLNAIPYVVKAPAGLLSMKDLPPPAFWAAPE